MTFPFPNQPKSIERAVTPMRDQTQEKKTCPIYWAAARSFLRVPWYCFFSAGVWKAP